MKKLVFALALVISTPFSKFAEAFVDPQIEWETLSTPHFEVVFDARHYQTARNYALRLEFNHKLLSDYFQDFPEKTVVIINDSTDLANGYASYIPYPHIMVYPVLPTAHESISEYADWPRELTLHEYTHILNFEPAHDFFRGLRLLMGNIISPTMLLPRWWHEGIAVEMETRLSTHGRLRSTYQDATLRALAIDEQLSTYTIADINESELESWPRGSRPYLFGSILISELQASKGPKSGDNLLQDFARRPPYLLNGPLEHETGKDFAQLLKESLKSAHSKAQAQLDKIRQQPVSDFKPVEEKYLESHSPQLSPNGRFLTFIAKNKWAKSSIQIFDRHEESRPFNLETDAFSQFLSIDNQEPHGAKDAPPSGNINRLAWLPDSSGFIFDQARMINLYAMQSDLFLFDLNAMKTKRITTGMRLREPGLSHDGKTLTAVQMEQSNTRLVILSSDGTNLKVLYSPSDFYKIGSPFFFNENTIIFTERDLNGRVTIKKIHLTNLIVEDVPLQGLRPIETLNLVGPRIVFVARENGLQNIYMTQDEFKSYRRLTHTETAVFGGTIDSRINTLYSTTMTSTGLRVMQSSLDLTAHSAPPPTIDPLLQDRYGASPIEPTNNDTLEKDFGSLLGPREPYSNLKYMRPRYWLPFVYFTESGYGTQISTATQDPLEKHAYSAQAGYDSFINEASLGFNYTNGTGKWPWSLGLSAQERNQPGLNFQFSAQQLNFLALQDLRPFSEYMTLGLGFNGRQTTTTSTTTRFGPQLIVLYDGSAKSPFSEVPFAGWRFSFYGNHFLKLDKLAPLTRGTASATYFYSGKLPQRHIAVAHVIAQKMTGNWRTEDLTPSDNFQLVQNFSSPRFVLRGYDLGYFYFSQAGGATFEYHIPLTKHYGWGTLPAFLKRTKLNLFADALAAEGFVIDYAQMKYIRTGLNKIYSSYGLELKGDFTLGYYYPITCLLGLYQRPDYSGPRNSTVFIGIQI